MLHAGFGIGAKMPLSFGLNLAGARGVWVGAAYGCGFTAEATFGTEAGAFGLEAYGLFAGDRYFLPVDRYTAGAYLFEIGIHYGIDLKFHFGKSYYFGFGPMLMYTLLGNTGDATMTSPLPPESIGHDFGAAVFTGYSFYVNENLAFPVEFRTIMNISAMTAGAVPFLFQVSVGVTIRLAK